MAKRALIVGLDEYDHVSNLSGCVADAQAMAAVLARHEAARPNFHCQVMPQPGGFLQKMGHCLPLNK